MKNPCIEAHAPHLATRFNELVKSGMSEREAGIKVALEEHQSIFNDINQFKKDIGVKLTKEQRTYVSPDTSAKVKEITDSYNAKIEAEKSKVGTQKESDNANNKRISDNETLKGNKGEIIADKESKNDKAGEGDGGVKKSDLGVAESEKSDTQKSIKAKATEIIVKAKKAIKRNPNNIIAEKQLKEEKVNTVSRLEKIEQILLGKSGQELFAKNGETFKDNKIYSQDQYKADLIKENLEDITALNKELKKHDARIDENGGIEMITPNGKIKFAAMDISRIKSEVEKNYPTTIPTKSKGGESRLSQPKRSAVGNYEQVAKSKRSLINAEENLAEAEKSGNKNLIQIFKDQLELEKSAHENAKSDFIYGERSKILDAIDESHSEKLSELFEKAKEEKAAVDRIKYLKGKGYRDKLYDADAKLSWTNKAIRDLQNQINHEKTPYLTEKWVETRAKEWDNAAPEDIDNVIENIKDGTITEKQVEDYTEQDEPVIADIEREEAGANEIGQLEEVIRKADELIENVKKPTEEPANVKENEKPIQKETSNSGTPKSSPESPKEKTKDDKAKTEKVDAKERLDAARLAFKKAGGLSSGGLESLPEFVELVKAYINKGLVDAKAFIAELRKEYPESKKTDKEIEDAFNKIAEQAAKEEGGELKERKISKRIVESKTFENEDIKQGILDEGIGYISKPLELSKADAKALVDVAEQSGELDALAALATNPASGMKERVKTVVLQMIFKKYSDISRAATDPTTLKENRQKATDVAMYSAERATDLGQGIDAHKVWKEMLGEYPELIVTAVKRHFEKSNEPKMSAHEQDVVDAKKILDDFIKSEEFEKAVTTEVEKRSEKAIGKERTKKIVDFFDGLKFKTDPNKSYNNPFGVVTGIYNMGIETMKQSVLLGAKVSDAIKAGVERINKELEKEKKAGRIQSELWDSKGFEVDMNEKLKDLETPKPKKVLTKKAEVDILSKWAKKLDKLSPERQKKLLGDAIKELTENGALSDARFRELYAKALGLKSLSDADIANLLNLQGTINAAEKAGEEFQNDPTLANKKAYLKAAYDARIANGKLSEFFGQDRTWTGLLGTFIQGNLLTFVSLIRNPIYNLAMMPLRFMDSSIASAADYLISKGAEYTWLSKIANTERTTDIIAKQKGYWSGFGEGIVEGVKQFKTGMIPEEAHQRELAESLHPFTALHDALAQLKSKDKVEYDRLMKDLAEGVFGISPEVMFRTLNAGDKPFRRAAQKARLRELAATKGYKGDALEKFMTHPDDMSKAEVEEAGLKATLQYDNLLYIAINAARKGIEHSPKAKAIIERYGALQGLAGLLIKSQAPYIKTPINVVYETFSYAMPELALAEAVFHSMQGNRRQALRLYGKATTGFMLKSMAVSLAALGIITTPGDDDEYKVKQAKYEYERQNMFNVSAFQRLMTGGNPQRREGDINITMQNMGVAGAIMSIHATMAEKRKKEGMANDMDYFERVAKVAPELASTALNQTFLTGVNAGLSAIQKGGGAEDKWLVQTATALSAVALPNTVAAMSKASDTNYRETRDVKVTDQIINNFKTRLFQGKDLPSKVSIWGEKVPNVPKDRSAWAYYMFDVSKYEKTQTSKFGYELFNLYKKDLNPDFLPAPVDKKFTYNKDVIELTPKEHEQFQILVGQNRKRLVERLIKKKSFQAKSDEEKIKSLQKAYEQGRSNAKRVMVQKLQLK